MGLKSNIFGLCMICSAIILNGQGNRTNTENTIGWYNYFGTFRLSQKMSLHTEYQWRRNDLIKNWQQGLLRTGLNYNVSPRLLLRVGYAWAETYAYGDIPINSFGRDFTEHRIFQMAQLSQKEGIVEISHRFMLEQRFVGRYTSLNAKTEDEYPFVNRGRYMVRLQIPLKGKEILDKTPYLAIFDEVMVGFGKNVIANIFDQNRIGLLLGYKFTKSTRFEAGYINQILQYSRQINNLNAFQYNNGIIINTLFNIDLLKSDT